MFENVLVFGGLANPAEGMFRNLTFRSYYGEISHFYCLIWIRYHCREYTKRVTEVELFLHQISWRQVPLWNSPQKPSLSRHWANKLSLAFFLQSLPLDWPISGQWQRILPWSGTPLLLRAWIRVWGRSETSECWVISFLVSLLYNLIFLRTVQAATNDVKCREACLNHDQCVGFKMIDNVCQGMKEHVFENTTATYICKKTGRWATLLYFTYFFLYI